MVMTVDGKAQLDGDTAKLGGETDRALFLALRNQVDCVIAGPRTISVESYAGPSAGAASMARREEAGLRPRPLFATVSRSGRLDTSVPLFADAGAEAIVFSEAGGLDFSDCEANVAVEPATDPVELLGILRNRYNVHTVLLEGGPTLNGPFFAADVVDDLFLTVEPLITADDAALPIVRGPLPGAARMHLRSALLDDDHLFLRYRID